MKQLHDKDQVFGFIGNTGTPNAVVSVPYALERRMLFFGAFTVKMLVLPKRGVPGWVLPVTGAIVFAVLILIWFTSAYWFFSTFGIHR